VVRPARRTEEAVAEAASLEEARAAAGAPARRAAGGPGTADPLVAELRRAGLLRLLVLHFCAQGPCYGNQLIERIERLTGGLVAVNPNTMYPLLRALESDGLVAGQWEHPERRSRRFYGITAAGEAERARLHAAIGESLDRVGRSIEAIREELAP
jgi:PadR family transcriptional regulator, regulatory protein PadR